jgi:hypothetical protein
LLEVALLLLVPAAAPVAAVVAAAVLAAAVLAAVVLGAVGALTAAVLLLAPVAPVAVDEDDCDAVTA